MSDLAPMDMVGAIGFLQKKSRFYGWSRHAFLLDRNGLAQLSTEHQSRPAKPVSCLSSDVVIGSSNGIDLERALAFKHKNFIGLSDMAYVAAQGSRELAITTASNVVVLRAQSSHERDQWIGALQQAMHCADKQCNASADQIPHVEEAEDASISISRHGSLAQSPTPTKPGDTQPFLLELALDSDSANNRTAGDLDLGIAGTNNVGPDNTMVWLPSMSNLVDPAAAPNVPTSTSAGDSIQLQALSNDQPPASAASSSFSEAKPNTTQADLTCKRVCVDMDAASFDADRFFEEGDNDDCANTDDLPSAGALVGACSKSELPLAISKSSHSTKGASGPNLTLLGQDQPNLALGSAADSQAAFGDFFGNFLNTLVQPSQDPVPSHAEMRLSKMLAHDAETLSLRGATSTYSVLPQANDKQAHTSNNAGGSSSSSNIPLGVLGTQHASSRVSLGTSGIRKLPPNDAVAPNVAESPIVLNSSIADIATSLLDTIGLNDYSALLSNPPDKSGADCKPIDANEEKSLQASSSTHGNLVSTAPKPPTKALDPPGQYSLGSQSIYKLKSAVSSRGLRAENKMRLDDPPGLQTTLLAKYSDSLNSSRALLSSAGGIGKPKTMHDWQANTTKANAERGMERTAPIVQYHAAKPADSGVTKVIRGHLVKDIIQKEAERKPAVRRIRRTKSDTKVPPLKAIRLKLNGSIVSSKATESKEPSSRGLGYFVKDGRIESLAAQNGLCTSATQSSNPDEHSGDNGSSQASPDALSEFSEIQRRLKQAEQHKQQLQQARMLDKNASDGICIGEILETRKDIPLAVQLEERRRVQTAKQQALLNQQLQQQRIQMEIQRQNIEQQQKYEQFKRQSLCPPDVKSSNRMSTISVSQPYPNAWPENGGGGNILAAQNQPSYSGFGCVPGANPRPYSMYQPPTHYPQQQPPRPTTPMSVYEPHMAWNYQQPQQPQHGARSPLSHHAQETGASTQSTDPPARAMNRSYSATIARRQAGSAFVKSERPYAKSEHSDASTESWQSHVAHSTRTSLHANTDSLKNGSVFIPSPTQSAAVSKRSSSFGYAESRRSALSQPDMQTNRFHPMYARGNVPPVPPIPQHIAAGAMPYPAHSQHGPPPAYMQQVPQGAPGYPQPPVPYGQWGVPPMHSHSWNSPYPQAPAAGPCPYQGYGSYDRQHSTIEAQRIHRKRTEMAAKVPSLLQQLNEAQITGVMPGQSQEKPGYSKGAYQNANVPKIIRENSGAHYLGNGNTLLIDQVHESEKTKRAFLKKVSRNYTGVGGDTAPTPVFMH
ncbi:hypothetical protein LPJ55_001766 [Coemansia sp. RSA 990]|nr:hypothetical protein LPJ55_001766 [Coemansia sp. RSA 990]